MLSLSGNTKYQDATYVWGQGQTGKRWIAAAATEIGGSLRLCIEVRGREVAGVETKRDA